MWAAEPLASAGVDSLDLALDGHPECSGSAGAGEPRPNIPFTCKLILGFGI